MEAASLVRKRISDLRNVPIKRAFMSGFRARLWHWMPVSCVELHTLKAPDARDSSLFSPSLAPISRACYFHYVYPLR